MSRESLECLKAFQGDTFYNTKGWAGIGTSLDSLGTLPLGDDDKLVEESTGGRGEELFLDRVGSARPGLARLRPPKEDRYFACV